MFPVPFPDGISADIFAAAAKLFTRLRLIRMAWKPRPVALYHDRSPSFSQGLGIDRVEGSGGVVVAGAGDPTSGNPWIADASKSLIALRQRHHSRPRPKLHQE